MSDIGNKTIFSKNLKHYINLSKKKNPLIAEELGFPYNTFLDWVNGNVYPRIDKIEAMANYFNIKKSDLIEDHNYNNNSSGLDKILFSKAKDLSEDDKKFVIDFMDRMSEKINKELGEE